MIFYMLHATWWSCHPPQHFEGRLSFKNQKLFPSIEFHAPFHVPSHIAAPRKNVMSSTQSRRIFPPHKISQSLLPCPPPGMWLHSSLHGLAQSDPSRAPTNGISLSEPPCPTRLQQDSPNMISPALDALLLGLVLQQVWRSFQDSANTNSSVRLSLATETKVAPPVITLSSHRSPLQDPISHLSQFSLVIVLSFHQSSFKFPLVIASRSHWSSLRIRW